MAQWYVEILLIVFPQNLWKFDKYKTNNSNIKISWEPKYDLQSYQNVYNNQSHNLWKFGDSTSDMNNRQYCSMKIPKKRNKTKVPSITWGISSIFVMSKCTTRFSKVLWRYVLPNTNAAENLNEEKWELCKMLFLLFYAIFIFLEENSCKYFSIFLKFRLFWTK